MTRGGGGISEKSTGGGGGISEKSELVIGRYITEGLTNGGPARKMVPFPMTMMD